MSHILIITLSLIITLAKTQSPPRKPLASLRLGEKPKVFYVLLVWKFVSLMCALYLLHHASAPLMQPGKSTRLGNWKSLGYIRLNSKDFDWWFLLTHNLLILLPVGWPDSCVSPAPCFYPSCDCCPEGQSDTHALARANNAITEFHTIFFPAQRVMKRAV